MGERWLPVVGYEGLYDISDHGRVMRMKGLGKITFVGRILKQQVYLGYHRVSLYKNGKHRYFRVHRLVMASFVGPPPDGNEINHIDGDKSNNHLENLEYVTPSANAIHAFESGLRSNCGENQPGSKLTEDDVREIRLLLGKETQASIAARFNVSRSTVSHIATGRNWASLK